MNILKKIMNLYLIIIWTFKKHMKMVYLKLKCFFRYNYVHIMIFFKSWLCTEKKLVCIILFVRLQGEPEKAENFLMDAMKSFHQEGWHHLADDMKLELAKCQKLLGNRLKYPYYCFLFTFNFMKDIKKSFFTWEY